MKIYLSLLLLLMALGATAQWSNTSNQFFDSLHMAVTQTTADQSNPLVVQSYPDSGYFVIWQDNRNYNVSKTDIYAQKYDKNGVRLWAENGMPVTTGVNNQFYVYSSNQDYRNRSFAATDSTGGFYICYTDDSVNNYSWPRATVQHVHSDGSAVFGGAGYVAGRVPADGSYVLTSPQLIADGAKGFYLAFEKDPYGQVLYIVNGKEENGAMRIFSSNAVNQNAVQKYDVQVCVGVHPYVEYPQANVKDYNIWSDGQGGCNIVMSLNANGTQGTMLGYNRIWRAKKASMVKTYRRNETGVVCPQTQQFKKDSTYMLYNLQTYFTTTACGSADGQTVYVVTSWFFTSNGFVSLDNGAYDYNYPKGVTIATDTNINITLLATTQRKLTGNSVSDFTVQGYAFKEEVFDSIPYERTSSVDFDFGYNYLDPTTTKFHFFRDTLLGSGNYYPDFSLAGGGNNFYLTSVMSLSGSKNVLLQRLKIQREATDSLSLQYVAASKKGDVIGREVYTGFSGSGISYDLPMIRVAGNGDGIFSILENGRFTRISPIWNRTRLTWGAMGRPAGTGIVNMHYYGNEQPFLLTNTQGGKGVLAWHDNRFINTNNNATDILMRHVDRLDDILYSPPRKPVRLIPNPYGPTAANPAVLMGSTGALTPFEISSIYYEPSTTTIAEIADLQNLGIIQMSQYQNTGTIRKYNGAPYLDRNLTVVPENTPAIVPTTMRIYFTKTEFDALKATEPLLQNPGDLAIIAQPVTPNDMPVAYVPVAGEKTYTPSAWDSLPGGYYVEFTTTGFGNFFITKSTPTVLCPGGSTSLTSNLSGSSYQWFVNMGSGFVLANGIPNISGANSATLQLTSVPSSWYGYKFQCRADFTLGNTYTLQFLANWVGGTSTDWNNPANWGCGAVPDANTDVMITSGNVIVNTNSSCRTLTVKPGASITVKPGVNLDVMK